jgi:hypothetical protein
MGAGGASGGSGTGPQELGYTTRDKRTDKQKQKDANVELGLGKDRMSDYSVSQGGTREGDGGQGTNILIAPTVAEVSQSNAANATTPVEEDPLYLRKKKTQAKGRSATILTSSKGVNEDSTLGKKSLLGA